METWQDIIDFEGLYQISNLGRLKSLPRTIIQGNGSVISRKETLLKPGSYGDYKMASLFKHGINNRIYVHILVATYFVDNPYNLPWVNHLDLNPANNIWTNLEWTDRRQNASHAFINKDTSSKYTGVYWHKAGKKWGSKIVVNSRPKHLGFFEKEIDAHFAYTSALKELDLTNKYLYKKD